MATEEEKRLHRCCFSGHRPEKLGAPETEVREWLDIRIEKAIRDGYTTFITGCSMGSDIWAGQIVLEKKAEYPELHLIAATPWPGFAARWNTEWKTIYNDLLMRADLVVNVSEKFHEDVFVKRNRWMVDHSNRMIVYMGFEPGGTVDMIRYALENRRELYVNSW